MQETYIWEGFCLQQTSESGAEIGHFQAQKKGLMWKTTTATKKLHLMQQQLTNTSGVL